jgi:sugar phosphate isomerase/epimerase
MRPIGLNPYGLAYTLGIHAAGTPRANPRPISLDDYIELAQRLGCGGIELHAEHLFNLPENRLRQMGGAWRDRDWWAVLARPLLIGQWERTIQVAKLLGARTIRIHCTPVLCGDRRPGACDWPALVADARRQLREASRITADHGLFLAIENHQDFCSDELLELCGSCGRNIGIALDTANPLAVAEDPLDAARAMAPKIRHVHFKDYRAHWSDEGYRLVRCPTGEGCIPIKQIAAIFADRDDVTASIEIGALNARHIRLLAADFWTHHAPRRPDQISKSLSAARLNCLADHEDWRTPWERDAPPQAVAAYELEQVERSVINLRAMGLM